MEAIRSEEEKLGKKLSPSFSVWLIEHNGTNIEGIHIFPVLDLRDKRMTWESLSHNVENEWAGWLEVHEDSEYEFDHLLPFANFGTGDYYCFDYSNLLSPDEPIIVHWSHETAETEFRAKDFNDFVIKAEHGEFEYD